MNEDLLKPDYLFEASWEVCNKVGEISDSLAAKSLRMKEALGRHHILIGPDVWMDTTANPDFTEDKHLYAKWRLQAASEGIRVRVGRWNVPGSPITFLVDYKQFLTKQNDILTEYWLRFGVDSISGNWDYKENVLFGYAAGHVIESFYRFNLCSTDKVVAQFHQWNAGAGLLYVKSAGLPVATVFTAHTTIIGTCLAGNYLPQYDAMSLTDADAKARQFNLTAQHSLEKASARNADVFTAVSDTVAQECSHFLQRTVDAVTPQGGGTEEFKAYSHAIALLAKARETNPDKYNETPIKYKKMNINNPSWKSVMVTRHLPEALSGLETLSKNLWWCWNESAKSLFESIDPDVWQATNHNPIALLDVVSLKKFKALAKDEVFLGNLRSVLNEFNEYMALKTERKDPLVGYFCMEYGLDTSLKIYSGGLGLLAGDYLKETSDMNVNLVAVGLLYRYGYFTQTITGQGEQVARYDAQDFNRIPAEPVLDAEGNWLTASVAFPGRNIVARIWKVAVGRTDLYLLDTDYEANLEEDRQVTYHLYGGDWENRLKQELLLGIGGIHALRALGINPDIYHCNEGHAAFTGLERLREYVSQDNLDFGEALEIVRASSLFTTHTPVPAGHDAFDEGMLRKYIGHYPQLLKVDWETMMSLGKINPTDPNEQFSMSSLAANCSQNVNGVSKLHGDVSKEIFNDMYPGYLPEELYISYVTNGVHYPTWAAKEWKKIHSKVFGPEFATHHYDKKCFEGIYNVPDAEIWETRKALKSKLVKRVKSVISNPSLSNHYSPGQIVAINKNLRDDVLTIGFARRFATYKRGTLLFSDLDRLAEIVNNPERPVQFLFAGKAHPADKAGQDLIKRIIEISKDERFLGKIVFVPGYDISIAKRLVQGVDVWMNNPTRPLEASGTSGEKAAMNGVMHFSVLDGWWVEGYKEGAGWSLPQERLYDDQAHQNELDAATIYSIIENEIAPAYYNVDPKTGYSETWIGYIKNTVAQVACDFTTNRMLTDYCRQYYIPQANRTESLAADDFRLARKIAAWKKRVRREWKNIEVISITQPNTSYSLSEENNLVVEAVLNLGDLTPEDIGVEMVFATLDHKHKIHIQETYELEVVSFQDAVATYRRSILPDKTGMYQVAIRMFAKNALLPHRQDIDLVKWL
ncbi:MAG: alpha-glucan family phosphorylase [Candidatus Cryptobacteroides sp.]